jgi:hypothetical protein
MKKAIFAVLAVFMAMQVSAVELWNGFTTDMTQDQVLDKARTDLKVTRHEENRDQLNMYESAYSYNTTVQQGSASDKTITNMIFAPSKDDYQRLMVYSPLSEYRESSDYYNIRFHFNKNKLYAVEISWAANNKDLINLTNKNFGNYTVIVHQEPKTKSWANSERSFYIWKLKDRLIYISGPMYFMDRSVIEGWITEREQRAEKEKTEAEAKRKAAAGGVKF